MNREDYAESHSFVWFIGVVEDINDPEEMGRVRVRCFGFHDANKITIPTESLPWASVMTSVTSASTSGVGNSSTGLVQGSWVVGFFRDGTSAQDPLIMGSLPSSHLTKNENKNIGFSDPDSVYPLEEKLAEPDVPREARKDFTNSYSYITKSEAKDKYKGISTANSGPSWNFPNVADVIKPTYPLNHVHAFADNSNVIEYDSTKDSHRFSHVGPNKTFTEIDKDGNESQVITGARYKVIAKGDNVYITGGCNLTIEGGCRTKIDGNWEIYVNGNKNEVVTGNVTETIKKNKTESVSGTIDQTAGTKGESTQSVSTIMGGGTVTQKITGNFKQEVTGNIDIDANRIDLN